MSPTLDQVIDMKEANLINLDGSHTSNMFSDKMLPPIYNTGNPNALIGSQTSQQAIQGYIPTHLGGKSKKNNNRRSRGKSMKRVKLGGLPLMLVGNRKRIIHNKKSSSNRNHTLKRIVNRKTKYGGNFLLGGKSNKSTHKRNVRHYKKNAPLLKQNYYLNRRRSIKPFKKTNKKRGYLH